MKQQDFLVEIQAEELPPKSIHKLGRAFLRLLTEGLKQASLNFDEESSQYFATPRRLAVLIPNLEEAQEDQLIERKGPALKAAFDDKGQPTPACVGFAKSCNITPDQLQTTKTPQGEWVSFKQEVAGKTVFEILPDAVAKAIHGLPVPKRMRWGDSKVEFSRPVHAVVMLYGEAVVPAEILGCKTGRTTLGHRFMSEGEIAIPAAKDYAYVLEKQGKVIPRFARRRELIKKMAQQAVADVAPSGATVQIDDDLLDEVTGLVEWPVALCGQFDEAFLDLPQEVLISSMQDHQRYFPVVDDGELLAYFVSVTNIESKDPQSILNGNQRVLRARLSDAAFFYETDQQTSLESRLRQLRDVVYQAKLGTLYDKAKRISALAKYIAEKMNLDAKQVTAAERAGWLAKTDLLTLMVGEFPELQGVMGAYYAKQDDEITFVVDALREQYLPRFSGDMLPASEVGQALALADKLDSLVGAFSIGQIPTGDKDPFGLRRATIGVLRIVLELEIDLDIKSLFDAALEQYAVAEKEAVLEQLMSFALDRLKVWYQDQGVSADIFASVAALGVNRPLDVAKRIHAVSVFKKTAEAEALSVANKRVSNILAKQAIKNGEIQPALFEKDVEKVLLDQIASKQKLVAQQCERGEYDKALLELAELRAPIDDFFDQVMVMTEDQSRRENRILLLGQLRQLFLHVADIALLQ